MQPVSTGMESLTGIAVDFGGSKIAVARLEAGVVIDQQRRSTVPDATAPQQVAAIVSSIMSMAPGSNEPVAVAVTGRVDESGNWHAINSSTLTQVEGIPLKSILETEFGRVITVVNDAVAGAVGEYLAGAGRGARRFAYITVSTGVGGACVIDGIPLTSASGLAGNIGFLTTRAGTRRCGCGRLGTVESIASGSALAQTAAELGHTGLSAIDVFDLYRRGVPWAVATVRESARAISELGVNLAAVSGITRIVLGGSVGMAQGYREEVITAMADEPPLFQLEVATAELGQSSVLVGALLSATRF